MRFTLILLLVSNVISAQQIDNGQCGAYTDMPFFNVSFIKANQIKSMKGAISFKKELDIIRPQYLIEIFEFDVEGKQTSSLRTTKNSAGKKDTSVVYFSYDDDYLICKRKSDTYGFFSDNYAYDSLGRVIQKTYNRDDNAGPNKFNFELKKTYRIVSEEYRYQEVSPQELKKLHYNNYKRPFMEEVMTWNKNGYLIEMTSKTVIGNRRSKTTFEYDEQGQVMKKTEWPNLDKATKYENYYIYDKLGNLIEHNFHKNNTHKLHRKLLYNGATMLLESQLAKEMSTGTITITKYKYTFYK
ncbi:MAG: hypothetical protein P8M05_08390 [Flavobacteriales bacterium]|nr:hypothetical protein [Flavobacteriales bacterium]